MCAECLAVADLRLDRWVSSQGKHPVKAAPKRMKSKQVCSSCFEHAPIEIEARQSVLEHTPVAEAQKRSRKFLPTQTDEQKVEPEPEPEPELAPETQLEPEPGPGPLPPHVQKWKRERDQQPEPEPEPEPEPPKERVFL